MSRQTVVVLCCLSAAACIPATVSWPRFAWFVIGFAVGQGLVFALMCAFDANLYRNEASDG